ncbi:tryptophan-rich sensory protein [Aequorivita sediminis]|uniref:tryptophan-rich sensory protein n=1 Tax=Aequorivita sediminis TaxID=3073653 RepID=UPI0028AD04CA|nr:tryptophan-rich sensory protein [Aequorivita sp. F6058]
MKKTLQISNIIAFLATVFINYFANTGKMNGTTVGEVSNNINSLLTPAGYAFSIWGVIYLMLLGFVVYQGRSLFAKVRDDQFILDTGWWFVISCIANCLWIVLWIYGFIGYSIIAIFTLLFSILKIVMKNRMELWDAPISVIALVWWPFVFYSGWVTIASVVNVAAYLKTVNWNGWGISEVTWTVVMIVLAGVINLIVTWKRNMREFALVGTWALVAIAVANWDENKIVVYVSLLVGAVLFISSSYHAFKNRETSPINKCKEYLNN